MTISWTTIYIINVVLYFMPFLFCISITVLFIKKSKSYHIRKKFKTYNNLYFITNCLYLISNVFFSVPTTNPYYVLIFDTLSSFFYSTNNIILYLLLLYRCSYSFNVFWVECMDSNQQNYNVIQIKKSHKYFTISLAALFFIVYAGGLTVVNGLHYFNNINVHTMNDILFGIMMISSLIDLILSLYLFLVFILRLRKIYWFEFKIFVIYLHLNTLFYIYALDHHLIYHCMN